MFVLFYYYVIYYVYNCVLRIIIFPLYGLFIYVELFYYKWKKKYTFFFLF